MYEILYTTNRNTNLIRRYSNNCLKKNCVFLALPCEMISSDVSLKNKDVMNHRPLSALVLSQTYPFCCCAIVCLTRERDSVNKACKRGVAFLRVRRWVLFLFIIYNEKFIKRKSQVLCFNRISWICLKLITPFSEVTHKDTR